MIQDAPGSPSGRPSVTLRRDPVAIQLARTWRDLTGGRARGRDHCRRTILACSGGGDSCGLAIALAGTVPGAANIFTIAHILHDMRPREQAEADRDAVRALARDLALPFVESRIEVRDHAGNTEAIARRLRYRALAETASNHRAHYIATAHHAQDQFETLLMALLRGTGLRGLRGIAPSRRIENGIRLIRPALDVDTRDLRRFCEEAGIIWREDHTNLDIARLRAALRHTIIPQLEQLRPGVAKRSGRSARLIAGAESLIARQTRKLVNAGRTEAGFAWNRAVLRDQPPIIIGAVLRVAAEHLRHGQGQDRLGAMALAPVIRAVKDDTTDPRRFSLAGLELTVTTSRIELQER